MEAGQSISEIAYMFWVIGGHRWAILLLILAITIVELALGLLGWFIYIFTKRALWHYSTSLSVGGVTFCAFVAGAVTAAYPD